MRKRSRFIPVADGDILSVKSRQFFYLTCCDCSLTHRIDVRVIGKEVRLGIRRDERRTSQKRRRQRERKI